jgi:hypothetical protein
MGCAASKNAVSVTPAADSSGALRDRVQPPRESHPVALPVPPVSSLQTSSSAARGVEKVKDEVEEPGKAAIAVAAASRSFRLRSLRKSLEGEQVAAGWPPWLSAVAAEAIQGWIPLKADSFQKLEKVLCSFQLGDSFRLIQLNSSWVIFHCEIFCMHKKCLKGGSCWDGCYLVEVVVGIFLESYIICLLAILYSVMDYDMNIKVV